MTLKELKEYFHRTLSNYKERCNSEWCERDFEAFKTIDEYMWYQEKYRWHDLRKNPEDLPNKSVVLLTMEQMKGYNYSTGIYDNVRGWIIDFDILGEEVIAWKYIEPFKESEE